MTIGDTLVSGAIDVSSWTELGYHDKAVTSADVPCQWAIGPYPADFRGPDEIAQGAWIAVTPPDHSEPRG